MTGILSRSALFLQYLFPWLCLRASSRSTSARVTVLDDNLPGEETFPPHAGPLELHAALKRQLDEDAALGDLELMQSFQKLV